MYGSVVRTSSEATRLIEASLIIPGSDGELVTLSYVEI